MNCVEELAKKMVPLLKDHTPSQVVGMFNHEDSDLVGEALVEAEARIAGEADED